MSLEDRVRKLESEQRRIKQISLALIVVAILGSLTMGAARKNYAAFDWISAYGFTLRDEAAKDRGGLAYDPKVGPYFCLKDKQGNTKVHITLDGITN
jgi:hypothetical protein